MSFGDDEIGDDEDLLRMKIPPMQNSLIMKEGSERLVITHIEVENFKSYYGKQVIGPFHKCFTSIIGPNGSGKSNVIDALLFVFGYRASKIRSKKVSVLIHSSTGKDNLHSCTVTVHFCKILDGKNRSYTKIDGTHISISRTGYKDNSSRYTINGRVAKFKEIHELLLSNGIDLLHNRFLILQGEVEQISMMKPKAEKEEEEGMLEYLEDIIGSSRLKPYIIKLHNKIEQINERRTIHIQRVQHAEKEKSNLDKPVREIFCQMRLENAITSVTNKIYSSKRYIIEEKIFGLKNNKSQLQDELESIQKNLADIFDQAMQVSKERQLLQNKLDTQYEVIQTITKHKSNQEQILAKAENDSKRLNNKRDKLFLDIETERKKLIEFELAPEKSQKKIAEYREQLIEANSEIEECSPILVEKLNEVRKVVQKEEKEKTKLEVELGKFIDEENKLNSQLVLLQEKLQNLNREEESQRRKFDSLQNELLDMEESLTKNEMHFAELNERIPDLEATLDGKTSRLKERQELELKLLNQVRELRRQYEELKQTEDEFSSGNKLLNRIMKAKKNHEIPGIYGRLGDLGAIHDKYNVAISTNFPQLDYILVDNVKTAQECIELLKRENLGTATFISLEKQQRFWQYIKRVPKTPENAPRLIDLIRVNDQEVMPAFYFVVYDTLVAEDIVSAKRISQIENGDKNNRWKTVTLKGEVIDISGAMTGGGNLQTRNRIGREVRVDTSHNQRIEDNSNLLADLEHKLSNNECELANIRRECSQLEPELIKRQDDLRLLKVSLNEVQLEIESQKATILELRKQLDLQKNNVIKSTADPAIVKKIDDEIATFKLDSEKIGEKTNSFRSKLMDINDKIENVNNEVAGPILKRKKIAEENKKNAENGINKEKANVTSNERNMKKTRTKIDNLEQDIQDIGTQLEAAIKRNNDANNQLKELDEILEQHKVDLNNAKHALDVFVQSISERNNEEVELQQRSEHIQRELKQLDIELNSIEVKLNSYLAKISKLRFYRLKKLKQTLSNEETAMTNHDVLENDEENNENLDILEKEFLDSERQKAVQKHSNPIAGDGLEKFLYDCIEEDDILIDNVRDNEQMEIDEEDGSNDNISSGRFLSNSLNKYYMPVPYIDRETIQEFDMVELERDLTMLEQKRKKERVNLSIVMDYMQKLNKYELEFRTLNQITVMRDRHRAFHDQLKKQRLHEFMSGFQQIATMLRTTYQMITIQGDVSLELVDSLDPFSEGIAFNVRPPKKSWKQITNLSGGEKTLASLSLVFGLHHYKPTPLYVMDEIDAALDFRNVSIIASYLLERTRNAQFIVISLRNQMYEKADRLLGIYKIRDCTKNVCLNTHKCEIDKII